MAIYGKVIKLKDIRSLTSWRTDHTSSELTTFRISKLEKRFFIHGYFGLICYMQSNLILANIKPFLKRFLNLAFNRVQVIVEELVLYGQVGLYQKLDGKYYVRISINIYSLTNRLKSCPASLVYKVS